MDELSVYLRKLKVKEREAAGGQLTAFLTALFHTLVFNESLKGATAEEPRYAILSPRTDTSFIDDARRPRSSRLDKSFGMSCPADCGRRERRANS